jgi:regulator of sigma E protease
MRSPLQCCRGLGRATPEDPEAIALVTRVVHDAAVAIGNGVEEVSVERADDGTDLALHVTLARSLKKGAMQEFTAMLTATINAAYEGSGVSGRVTTSTTTFAGVGMCDYRISLVPFGGYVKIAGMIDETTHNFSTHSAAAPQSWEFRSHPAWQKAIVISAGVIMNVILAGAIYIGLRYTNGEEVWRTRMAGVVAPGSAAALAKVQPGDEIIAVDGVDVSSWNEIYKRVVSGIESSDVILTLRSGGVERKAVLPHSRVRSISDSLVAQLGLFAQGTRQLIEDVSDNSPAAAGGLKAGDTILSANDSLIATDYQFIAIVRAHAGQPLVLEVQRKGDVHRLSVVPDTYGKIGVAYGSVYLGPKDTLYSFSKALIAGVTDVGVNFSRLGALLSGLITGHASVRDNLGGPLAIAKMAGRSAERGMGALLALMASLSISLAGLNILPVPALDGGHLVFILVEAAMGREVSNKVKMVVQQVGFALVLLLMVFVVYNDLSR